MGEWSQEQIQCFFPQKYAHARCAWCRRIVASIRRCGRPASDQARRGAGWVARCTVERLMKRLGLEGVSHSKAVRTAVADTATAYPMDRVNRQFQADRHNPLWVSDFTYVSTWQSWLYKVQEVFDGRIDADIQIGWFSQVERLRWCARKLSAFSDFIRSLVGTANNGGQSGL